MWNIVTIIEVNFYESVNRGCVNYDVYSYL